MEWKRHGWQDVSAMQRSKSFKKQRHGYQVRKLLVQYIRSVRFLLVAIIENRYPNRKWSDLKVHNRYRPKLIRSRLISNRVESVRAVLFGSGLDWTPLGRFLLGLHFFFICLHVFSIIVVCRFIDDFSQSEIMVFLKLFTAFF